MADSLIVSPSDVNTGGEELVTSTNNSPLGEQMRTILDKYREWLRGKAVSENTVRQYGRIAEGFLTHLESRGKTVDTMDESDTESFRTAIGNKAVDNEAGRYSKNSMRHTLSGVNSLLTFLNRKELLLDIPDRQVRRKLPLKHEEVLAMIKASEDSLKDHLIIVLLAETGRRSNEIRNLEVKNIDLEAGKVLFLRTKDGNDHWTQLAPECVGLIKKYLAEGRSKSKGSKYLLISSQGNQINSNDIGNVVARVASKAKIARKVTPHQFRRYKVTRMLKEGVPLNDVRIFVGQKDIKTTQGYIDEDEAQINEAALKTSVYHDARTTTTPLLIVDEDRPRPATDPFELKRIAVEKFLQGEMSEESFNRTMSVLEPVLEGLR
jgi:integrase/recombinase XerD